MNSRPNAGATGNEIFVQLCQGCHNSRLDQSLSRARFNVEQLAQMSADELAAATAELEK